MQKYCIQSTEILSAMAKVLIMQNRNKLHWSDFESLCGSALRQISKWASVQLQILEQGSSDCS